MCNFLFYLLYISLPLVGIIESFLSWYHTCDQSFLLFSPTLFVFSLLSNGRIIFIRLLPHHEHCSSSYLQSSHFLQLFVAEESTSPLLSYQYLLPLVDSSSTALPYAIIMDGNSAPNLEFTTWQSADQRVVILLHASLSEEAFSEIVGLSIAWEIWVALEAAYSNSLVERIQNLHDQLRQVSKGSSSVSEFGRKFRSLYDQLSTIGHLVTDSDKIHWFLCGLGAPFEKFSTAIRASCTPLPFRDLLAQAKGHELFLKSIHGSVTPPVAFFVQIVNSSSS